MQLRCIKSCTRPSPYRTYEEGNVYQLEVEYDRKKHPWLKFFAEPPKAPTVAPPTPPLNQTQTLPPKSK